MSTAREKDEVMGSVRGVVGEIMGLDPSGLSGDSDLLDLGADSLQFVVIVSELEDTFRVELSRSYAIPGRCSLEELTEAILCSLP